MDSDFKYKHYGKAPWVAVLIWTVFMTYVFRAIPIENAFEEIFRLFFFGASWWYLFEMLDDQKIKYRKRYLADPRDEDVQ